MSQDDRKRRGEGKTGPNKAEHQRRAAEQLRENLRRRKEQQRKQAGKPGSAMKDDPDSKDGPA